MWIPGFGLETFQEKEEPTNEKKKKKRKIVFNLIEQGEKKNKGHKRSEKQKMEKKTK